MSQPAAPTRHWDPIVRITHWTIALAVLANAVVTEEGSAPHIWVGYGLAAILALRLLWGLIGPTEARFTSFLPSASKVAAHIREIRTGAVTHHASHNPLGSLMVYAIWTCLIAIIATGIAMAGPPRWIGEARADEHRAASATAPHDEAAEQGEQQGRDENGEESEGEEGAMGEIHETAATLLYLLILLHIAGVVFETRRSGKQVLVAMAPFRR